MALGHVVLREFHLDRQTAYFDSYCRQYTDMPMLVRLEWKDGYLIPARLLRASEFAGALGESNNPDWKRSEEHTSELQSLMRISYAVFCLKKKNTQQKTHDPIERPTM